MPFPLGGSTEAAATRQVLCSEEARAAFPETVAGEYVRRYFSAAARQQARDMVDKLAAVLRERIRTLSWMTDSTRRSALAKLDSLVRNVGYSDRERTSSVIVSRPDDYFGNRVRIAESGEADVWTRLTTVNDRAAWRTSAALPRALYNPPYNQLTITAASLQPPVFVPGGDVATNYGAVGVVIGHELTHAFDVIGGRFDASGNLRNWWTKEDADRYAALTRPLVEQFNAYRVDSTRTLNGQSTLAENMSDLGGLEVAFVAMQGALDAKSRRPIAGFTPEQRFFLAYARLLKQNERGESTLDPANATHSPPRWRVNGPLSNLSEFARVWSCREADPMVRAERDRVIIW